MKNLLTSRPGRAWPAAALLALGPAGPALAQNFAATRTDYATGTTPLRLVVVDVNADGRPDLVTAHVGAGGATASSVGVRLAAGPAGAFATARTDYATPGVCLAVAVADVNADGRPDLLTTHSNRTVGIRLAAGPAGGFATGRTDYPISTYLTALVTADVNADGRPDLVGLDPSDVFVYLATGAAGTFAPAGPAYPTGNTASGSAVFGLSVADVNADGRPDLLTTNGVLGTVGVRLASAAVPGTFVAARTDYPSGLFSTAVVAADVNADGRPDLLAVDNRSSAVSVRLANAAVPGTFAATRADYGAGNSARSVAVADVNADGRLDLVTVHEGDNTVGVRLAAGPAGVFAATRTDYATGLYPYDVAVADVNADGRPDLITLHENDNTVGVRLNTSTLAAAPALTAAAAALWPNPTGGAGAVTVSLPAAAGPPPTATLLDALGRVVRPVRALAVAGGQATATLPTAGLPPGLYLLRLSGGAGTRCQRLVVE